MRELDPDTWGRREAYEFFSRISDPFYMVSFRQDVTKLYGYTKKRGLSFYMGMIWACTEAVNRTEAFAVAVRGGRLVRLDGRDPSFTDMRPGAEQFHIVTMPHMPAIDAFCREAVRLSRAQRGFIDPEKESDALIYYSCLPWIDLTGLTNERDMASPGALDDSIPRIAWGRYTEDNGRVTLGLSIEVNHRFIDGVHIGRFAEALTRVIERLESEGSERNVNY